MDGISCTTMDTTYCCGTVCLKVVQMVDFILTVFYCNKKMKLGSSKSLKECKEMFSMKLKAESDPVARALVILVFCRLRQEAYCEFEVSVNDSEIRPTRAT